MRRIFVAAGAHIVILLDYIFNAGVDELALARQHLPRAFLKTAGRKARLHPVYILTASRGSAPFVQPSRTFFVLARLKNTSSEKSSLQTSPSSGSYAGIRHQHHTAVGSVFQTNFDKRKKVPAHEAKNPGANAASRRGQVNTRPEKTAAAGTQTLVPPGEGRAPALSGLLKRRPSRKLMHMQPRATSKTEHEACRNQNPGAFTKPDTPDIILIQNLRQIYILCTDCSTKLGGKSQ